MIENFLVLQWRAGALAGAKPEDAFFVKVGLGLTMTSLDILEGRMIVEIGMAAVPVGLKRIRRGAPIRLVFACPVPQSECRDETEGQIFNSH